MIGEAHQFDQGTGALGLRTVIGKTLLPGELVQLELLDERVITGNVRLDDVELLNKLMEIEKQMFKRLINGLIDRCPFGQGAMNFALAYLGTLAQLVKQAAADFRGASVLLGGESGSTARSGVSIALAGGCAGAISGKTRALSVIPAPEFARYSRRARRSAESKSKASMSAIREASNAATSLPVPVLRSRLARIASRMADSGPVFSGLLIDVANMWTTLG